jgi:hypothetical protein
MQLGIADECAGAVLDTHQLVAITVDCVCMFVTQLGW